MRSEGRLHGTCAPLTGWTVTWRVPWQVPLGPLCGQVNHPPADKVWATPAGLSHPLDCGRYVHTDAELTLSPPAGTQCQHSGGSCFASESFGVPRVPSGPQALWGVSTGWRCHRCGASTRVIDPLVRWVGGRPMGGYSRCAGISQRGFAVPPPCPGRLRDAASHRPAAASRLSLPRGGTWVAHSR